MLDNFESKITFEIPTNLDFETMALSNNYTLLLTGIEEMDFNNFNNNRGSANYGLDSDYDRFMNVWGDVWVGIVLTLMIVTSIFCMCACFLYHKFRQWKHSVSHYNASTSNTLDNVESGRGAYDTDSLPSYTLVSGLPSYDDALEFYRNAAQVSSQQQPPPPPTISRPSLMKLFSFENHQIKELGVTELASEGLFFETNNQPEAVDGNKKELLIHLPSYEETIEEKKSSSSKKINRQILHFDFKLKVPNVPSSGSVLDTQQTSSINRCNTVYGNLKDLPKLHKSPSLTLISDSEFNNNEACSSNMALSEEQRISSSCSRTDIASINATIPRCNSR